MGTGNSRFTVFSGLGVIGLASLIALDPDMPAPFRRIRFKLSGDKGSYSPYLNDNLIGPVSKGYDWKPERGNLQLSLRDDSDKTIDIVSFKVH